MKKKNLIYTLVICLISISCTQEGSNNKTNTSNPVYCNPINLNYNVQRPNADHTNKSVWLREGADPSIAIFEDNYYLFSSVSDCYWRSSDLVNWNPLTPSDTSKLPILYSYAPTVVIIKDKMYLKDGNGAGSMYSTSTPDNPDSWLPIPGSAWHKPDTQFFLDDDGKLWDVYGCSPTGYLHIQEIDTTTFSVKGELYSFFMTDVKNRGWERGNAGSRGNNDIEGQPWTEGGQLFKYKGKYYFVYCLPQLSNTYTNGVYVSDHLLGPYKYQQHNPLTQKLTGFVVGTAHGQVFEDKYGNWWTLTCLSVWAYDRFERRIGLFPTFIDDDGTLHTDTYLGDYPTYAYQGLNPNPGEHLWTGMNLLSHDKPAEASSVLEGREAEYGVDEKIDTWWSAESGDLGEWFLIDLLKEYSIEGVQTNFSEQDLTGPIDENACMKYIIEASVDAKKWKVILDKSDNKSDVPHDFVLIENPGSFRYIRITNEHVPYGGKFALRGLRVFGHGEGEAPLAPAFKVKRSEDDPREALLSWEETEGVSGYIIRHGIAEDKLYNSNIVYNTSTYDVRSLDRGRDYYFTVDAFNENGVGQGSDILFAPSSQPGVGVSIIEAAYN
jgi:xylan 1,4-beta-xylosidase